MVSSLCVVKECSSFYNPSVHELHPCELFPGNLFHSHRRFDHQPKKIRGLSSGPPMGVKFKTTP